MKKSNTYCPGTACGIRFNCKRFIAPQSKTNIKQPIWWLEPQYDKHANDCPMYNAIQ